MTAKKLKALKSTTKEYRAIREIDGRHPLKEQASGCYVEYQARKRKGGKVVFFNVRLAKEMGLVEKNHPDVLNSALEEALLDAFAVIIINEWDMAHGLKVNQEDLKPHRYMATRYLQLQHPDKTGLFSGDGRSIWNGVHKDPKGRTWDISSCGTGATCLSPASAINHVYYKSGDKSISYGCGYSELSEGIIDVLFSEVFNRNGIKAERTLCVIEFPGNFCVTVRAGLNLLRPSHFFNHLRQSQFDRLKSMVDFFIDRELANQTWPELQQGDCRYEHMLNQVIRTFAEICAVYESQYIFCWLDWDGDNILADGGVIDFGSVRIFGLYHHTYRFDDDDRWSTNIKEQKHKAKHILASFAQIVDYLKTGTKKPHSKFRHSKATKQFDKVFDDKKRQLLLKRLGFTEDMSDILLQSKKPDILAFEKIFYALERAVTKKGYEKLPDGISRFSVYNMRDLLRDLPMYLSQSSLEGVSPKVLLKSMRSKYADADSLKLTGHRYRQLQKLQDLLIAMIDTVAKRQKMSAMKLCKILTARSQKLNRSQRITGDSVCVVGDKLFQWRRSLTSKEYFHLIQAFLEQQVLDPDEPRQKTPGLPQKLKEHLTTLDNILIKYREGI